MSDAGPLERLQKVLAHAGVASRREAEALILAGRVAVDGKVVRELGTRVAPARSVITVDGKVVHEAKQRAYVLLHKPPGYISTARDTHGRPTVLDLAPTAARLFPVGRLDADSEGLLLLTDDGELAYRLTHPRFAVERAYLVHVDGTPTEAELQRLRVGVALEDGMTAPARVERWHPPAGQPREKETAWLLITMHEGRKRQVRRMCEAIGHPVRRLIRVRIGPLGLGNLPSGSFRHLTADEVARLRSATGLTAAAGPAPA